MKNHHMASKKDPAFWRILLLIAVFYFVPGIQVVTQRLYADNAAGCRINHKCMTRSQGIPAINNILSNVLYIIFGCSFIYFVKYRQSITEWSKSLSSPKGSKGVEIIESKTSPAPPLPPPTSKAEKCGVRQENDVY